MERPEQLTEEPTAETLMEWADAGGCRATDGCWLEQDEETCAHGHPSWAIALGLVPTSAGD